MTWRDLTERYSLQGELGRGSIGVVYRAIDRDLKRSVAVKTLRSELSKNERHRSRFWREAEICAALYHPNIVSIFDVGLISLDPNLSVPCLVMAILGQRTLRQVIRQQDASLRKQISWLVQICHGLAFAHQQNILHRDIKPAHIFLGDFGEVTLADWGLARRLGSPLQSGELPNSQDVTRIGDIIGTPAYMSPEQAEGRIHDLDARSDLYSVGTILYEILAGSRPYEATRSYDVLRALRHGPPESPSARAPNRIIPPILEATCLKAMARQPADRFQNVLDFAASLESWLEASSLEHSQSIATTTQLPAINTEITRKTETADAHAYATGAAESNAFSRQWSRFLSLKAEATRLRATLPSIASIEALQPAEQLDREAREAEEQAAWHLCNATDQLNQAAQHDFEGARSLLARLHRDVWRASESKNEVISAIYHHHLAEQFDDGMLAGELTHRAALTVQTEPAGAKLEIEKIDVNSIIWKSGQTQPLGETPLLKRTVGVGHLLLKMTSPDNLHTQLPLYLDSGSTPQFYFSLPPQNAIPPQMIWIPGGTFTSGYDDHAPGAHRPSEIELPPYCLAKNPVTCEEYFEFLNHSLQEGIDIQPHLPRLKSTELTVFHHNQVEWAPNVAIAKNSPIIFITYDNAIAYSQWLSKQTGFAYRLPNEYEWVFAAGAVDRRAYPWGDRFYPGICDSGNKDTNGPSALTSFPMDESPFGIHSMAGGVHEWTTTIADRSGRVILRGGSWRSSPDECRIGARITALRTHQSRAIGFRLAADLSSNS